jgi:hypothetical protein
VKKEHWNDFLEDISNRDVWIANRYISSPGGDGGKTRIPILTTAQPGTWELQVEVVTNEEKSDLLAKYMFPGKPTSCTIPRNQKYSAQLPTRGEITHEQIWRDLTKLSLYKATVYSCKELCSTGNVCVFR